MQDNGVSRLLLLLKTFYIADISIALIISSFLLYVFKVSTKKPLNETIKNHYKSNHASVEFQCHYCSSNYSMNKLHYFHCWVNVAHHALK